MVTVRFDPPVFIKVRPKVLLEPTLTLPKARLEGVKLTVGGPGLPPVPKSDTVCGLPPPADAYEIDNAAVRNPEAAGVKVTE